MPEENIKEQSFELNLLFEKEKAPADAFTELGNVFQAIYDFDKWMLNHFDREANIQYSLQDIQYSSIKTKIAQILRVIPDDAIRSLDWKSLIGNFLLKAKYLFLKKLEQNKTIDSKAILESLTTEINTEINTIEKQSFKIIFPEINIYILLNNIEVFTKLMNALPKNESIEYKSKYGTATLSNGFFFNKFKIITELGATTVTNETTEILKIKKIDMLSKEARWDFKLGTRTIAAHILDTKWLIDYHKREIDLKPEDSLKVILKSSYTYTANSEHTLFNYDILKVIEIISPQTDSPPSLFQLN